MAYLHQDPPPGAVDGPSPPESTGDLVKEGALGEPGAQWGRRVSTTPAGGGGLTTPTSGTFCVPELRSRGEGPVGWEIDESVNSGQEMFLKAAAVWSSFSTQGRGALIQETGRKTDEGKPSGCLFSIRLYNNFIDLSA